MSTQNKNKELLEEIFDKAKLLPLEDQCRVLAIAKEVASTKSCLNNKHVDSDLIQDETA